MKRTIQCAGCGDNLGEIRNATLKKNLVLLCEHCENIRQNALYIIELSNLSDYPYKDLQTKKKNSF